MQKQKIDQYRKEVAERLKDKVAKDFHRMDDMRSLKNFFTPLAEEQAGLNDYV